MKGSVSAELLLLRKRTSTWILLGIWTALASFFSYLLPYLEYRNGDLGGGPGEVPLEELLPQRLAGRLSGGFPFFGGVFALMLGVLALGSEYGWGTLRTVLVQRPGRLRVFAAKLVALGAGLVPFVFAVFVVGTLSSYAIARNEGIEVAWPSVWELVRALAAGWLILAVWAALGVTLGVLSRGTALAIGVGILYALVIEGLISAFADQVSVLEPLVEFLLRANAYSLVEGLGASTTGAATNGPGAFSGPYVGGTQAFIVLAGYVAAFIGLSGFLLRRRDVT
jgi:ABC-type transport system involved in multi-copper enzyme maturation permease subunit